MTSIYFSPRELAVMSVLWRLGSASVSEVRDALDLDVGTPVVLCDARDRESCKSVLITLVEHLIVQASASVA